MVVNRMAQFVIAVLLMLACQNNSVCSNEKPTSDGQTALSIEESLTALSLTWRTPIDLSPDGKWIAYTLQDPRKGRSVSEEERYRYFTESGGPGGKVGCDVWITNVTTQASRNLTQGKGDSWGSAWSPDGRYLAFYSDRSGAAHLWVWNMATGRLSQITEVIVRPRDGFDQIRWTADSRKVLVKVLPEGLSLKEANEAITSADDPLSAEKKQPGSTVRLYRSLTAPRSGVSDTDGDATVHKDPFTKALRADLALIDIKDEKLERLARGYNPLWYGLSPDGESVAFTTNKGQQGANNHRSLFDLVVISKGGRPQVVAADIVQAAIWFSVSWSPDSKWLSYTVFGERACYFVSSKGGAVRKVTGLPASTAFLSPPRWDLASQNVYLQTANAVWKVSVSSGSPAEVVRIPNLGVAAIVGRRDASQLWTTDSGGSIVISTINEETKQSGFYKVDLKTGAYTRLIEEDKSYGFDLDFNLYVSDDGQTLVYTAEDGGHFRNFWTVSTGFQQPPRQITDINPQFSRQVMGKGRIVEWSSLSGKKLRGVLVLPTGYVEGKRYPLIVRIYGGWIQSDVLNTFGFTPGSTFENLQILATRGYALFLPDSYVGVGTAMKDLADSVLPGVNKVVELGVADPDRLGVVGQSFGGYSTLALIVQTPRFRAAIVRSGLANLIGIYGEMQKDGSAFAIGVVEDGSASMRGSPWQYRQRYIENSPIFYLDRVQTPVFIVHGTEDTAVAPFLADEVFVGLRRLGKEAVYAKYEGEGHGLRNYANQLDYWYRAIEWFDSHLQAQTAASSVSPSPRR